LDPNHTPQTRLHCHNSAISDKFFSTRRSDSKKTSRHGRHAGRSDHQLADREILADAINQTLAAKGIRRTDETRRVVEDLEPETYRSLSYYERWIVSMEKILTEKKILTAEEMDQKVAEFDRRWGEP
jgi:hypothetical protein